jgi:hypothetical protein
MRPAISLAAKGDAEEALLFGEAPSVATPYEQRDSPAMDKAPPKRS